MTKKYKQQNMETQGLRKTAAKWYKNKKKQKCFRTTLQYKMICMCSNKEGSHTVSGIGWK